MIYLKHDPHFVDLNLGVQVRINENELIHISGTTVNYLAGRKNVWYQFPNFFTAFRIRGFINTIVNDIDEVLSWYEIFNTPADCINEIVEGRHNIYIKGGYDLVLNFLNEVKADEKEVKSKFSPNRVLKERWQQIFK